MTTRLLPLVLELTKECKYLKDLAKQGPEEIDIAVVMQLCIAIKDAMQEGFEHGNDPAIDQEDIHDPVWLVGERAHFAVMSIDTGKIIFLGTLEYVSPLWYSEFAGMPCGAHSTKEGAVNAVVLAAFG